ncbi:MAG: hypothetical protein KDG44_12240 [Burkholderiaceae bacterium]|jgi:hypothetical protein|nr:hypothetical protein [Burkholderiaceae bacterium]
MTQDSKRTQEPVRLLFEMTRDDNPRLYDDLIRFNKGTKRVNRLRFLAHEGLVAQNSMAAHSAAAMGAPASPASAQSVNSAVACHTNQVFDAPPLGDR